MGPNRGTLVDVFYGFLYVFVAVVPGSEEDMIARGSDMLSECPERALERDGHTLTEIGAVDM